MCHPSSTRRTHDPSHSSQIPALAARKHRHLQVKDGSDCKAQDLGLSFHFDAQPFACTRPGCMTSQLRCACTGTWRAWAWRARCRRTSATCRASSACALPSASSCPNAVYRRCTFSSISPNEHVASTEHGPHEEVMHRYQYAMSEWTRLQGRSFVDSTGCFPQPCCVLGTKRVKRCCVLQGPVLELHHGVHPWQLVRWLQVTSDAGPARESAQRQPPHQLRHRGHPVVPQQPGPEQQPVHRCAKLCVSSQCSVLHALMYAVPAYPTQRCGSSRQYNCCGPSEVFNVVFKVLRLHLVCCSAIGVRNIEEVFRALGVQRL